MSEMNKLSNHNWNILREIQQYVSPENDITVNDYAVMLTAPWGTGKTYFFKNTIKPFLEGKTTVTKIKDSSDELVNEISLRVIYCSLNGISNRETLVGMLDSLLKFSIYPSETSALGSAMRLANMVCGEEVVESETLKRVFLCVDDLERVPSDFIEEALGCINLYIEHKGIRILFLCAEDKLDNKDTGFGVDAVESNANEPEETEPKNNSAAKYELIKEKYIRQTLRYEPVLREIVENDESRIVLDNANTILDIFTERGCSNVRTWFYIRYYLKRIEAILQEQKYEGMEFFSKIRAEIVCALSVKSIEKRERGNEVPMFSSYTMFHAAYPFLDYFMESGVLDEEQMFRQIENVNSTKIANKKSLGEMYLNEFGKLSMLTKEELGSLLADLKRDLTSSNFAKTVGVYLRVFSEVLALQKMGYSISLSLDDFKTAMSNNEANLQYEKLIEQYQSWRHGNDPYSQRYYRLYHFGEAINDKLNWGGKKEKKEDVYSLLKQAENEKLDRTEELQLSYLIESLDLLFEEEDAKKLFDLLNVFQTGYYPDMVRRCFVVRFKDSYTKEKEMKFIESFSTLLEQQYPDGGTVSEMRDLPLILMRNDLRKLKK